MNENLIKIDEYLDKIRYVLEHTCHLCTNNIPDGDIKHKIEDSTICDSCWNKLKVIMDQEDDNMSDLYTEFTEHLNTPPDWWVPGGGLVEFERLTPKGEDNIKKGGNIMGYSYKAKAAEANADKNFITISDITIERANEIKEGTVMFDMSVGHVKIYGMSMRHLTTKKGEEFDAISFPARKADNGKYYDIAWFPMSIELRGQIAEKVINKLNS